MKQKINFLKNSFLNKKAVLIIGLFVLSLCLLLPQFSQAGPVYIYEHTGYGGVQTLFVENHPNFNDLPMYGLPSWNDQVSSIKVPSGTKATLYEHTNYGGTSFVFTSGFPNFNTINFNDVASSIKICENHCSPSGTKQCTDSTHYVTCGNYDSDPCTEWSSSSSCPSGQTCSGAGVCSTSPPTCSNQCSPSGKKECTDNTHYKTCGNYDADSCLEWSSSSSCPSGQTCSGAGVCSTSPPTCSNQCSPSGKKECTDNTHYKTCGNYDADSCLEWSSSSSCPSGQTCSGGVCSIPTLTNRAPITPDAPRGPEFGDINTTYSFSASTTDPDGDKIRYTFWWGDGTSATTEYVNSGTEVSQSHSWGGEGDFGVWVFAEDIHGAASTWSESVIIIVVDMLPAICNCDPIEGQYKACYFAGTNASQINCIKETTEAGPNIDHNWHDGVVVDDRVDNLSGTWRGFFNFEQGKYDIECFADNGIIIQVDGNEVYREFAADGSIYAVWCDDPPTLELSGRTQIKVTWNEKDGNAALRVNFNKVEIPEPPDDCAIGYGAGYLDADQKQQVWNQLISALPEDLARTFFFDIIPMESSWNASNESVCTNCYCVGLYQLEDATRPTGGTCGEYHSYHHWTCQTPHAVDLYNRRGPCYWHYWYYSLPGC